MPPSSRLPTDAPAMHCRSTPAHADSPSQPALQALRPATGRAVLATAVLMAALALLGARASAAQEVVDFTLVNAATDADIRTFSSDTTVRLDDLPTTDLSIRANTDPSTVGSVEFDFAGTTGYQSEGVAPYALGGDSNGDYDPVPELAQAGSYALTATPYTDGGAAGTAKSVTVTVESGTSGGSDPACEALSGPIVDGAMKRWHALEITFEGPCTSEGAGTNPFLDYRLNVTFEHAASGTTVEVPGYYAADGNAAETGATGGNRWRVHFTPRRTGDWTYTASFRTGPDVAVSQNATAGTATGFDGASGSFSIGPTDKTGRDHRGRGILTNESGGRYLRFDDGTLFLKGGADSPENLLAYSDFDGTVNNGGTDYTRSYEPHVSDWTTGDPSWDGGRGKGLIGALNYLASEGMNAFSFLTMNVGGDGDDVWPWTGPYQTLRYDISKLAQWEVVFTHSDSLGLFKHFKTQETENDSYLGSLGRERKLYYRELIARFGHHHALNWNLGEENTNTDAERTAFIDYISALDPYNHPIVVHTYPNQKEDVYGDLVNDPQFNGPSLQLGGMSDTEANGDVTEWIDASRAAGEVWNVSVDEPGTAGAGLRPDGDDNYPAAREVLWSTLLGGADGIEWYFGYQYADNDLNADDWRSRDAFWDYHRYALDFMRDLPVETMQADNARLSGEDGYLFSDGSDVFVAYLKDSADGATLDLPSGEFTIRWFDPRQGGSLQEGTVRQVNGGSGTALGAPPYSAAQGWVVRVDRSAALPVEMSGISATTDGSDAAVLTWQTASETNNAGFAVQHRGPDSRAFREMGFVEGAGTVASPQTYRYRATGLDPGTHVFRLEQVDVDGTTTLSDTVRVQLSVRGAYALTGPVPNPVREQGRVTLRVQKAQNVEVALYDALGRQVRVIHDGRVSPRSPLVLRVRPKNANSGAYLLRVRGERFTATRRVVIIR